MFDNANTKDFIKEIFGDYVSLQGREAMHLTQSLAIEVRAFVDDMLKWLWKRFKK